MSVFEEQTADQLSGGVDTDAAFNQTAQQFVPTLADVINDPSRDASLPSCEAFAGEIVTAKKTRKPRKSKKLQSGQIGTQVQIDLHKARMEAARKIKHKLLLPSDYKAAYEHLDKACQTAMETVIPLCVAEMDKAGG